MRLRSNLILLVIDGYEIARRVRALPGSTSIALVALTGYGQPDDRARARAAGFDLHVTKPIAADHLERLLGELAARSQQEIGGETRPPETVSSAPNQER